MRDATHRATRLAVATLSGWVVALSPLAARAQAPSRFSLDSVSAVDMFKGDGTTGRPTQSVDISSVIRVSDRWSVQVRPWFFKSSANGATWSKEYYQASLRYQRVGTIAWRVDLGDLPSPIGFGMTDMRADTNPTIQAHPSYFVPLMPFDRAAPRVNAMTASYPIGAMATASHVRWDLRGGLLASTPVRRYALPLAGAARLRATPTAFIGGGVTPIIGLRLGASYATGPYATTAETTDGGNRDLRLWSLEGEYAFSDTKVTGEFTSERFSRGALHDTARTWYVQGVQTLTPRWYAAMRFEGIRTPPAATAINRARLSFRTTERTIAYRVTPDWTVRASLTSLRGYTATTSDTRVGAQLVWARRWW